MVSDPSVSSALIGSEQVWGCVLIGGKSARMGSPKHLLERRGKTWLELIIEKLQARTDQVVISGEGTIPDSLQDLPVVQDVNGVDGPLAGIMAVMQKFPDVSWLVVACDMPDIETAALDWLLDQRAPGVTAILPELGGNGLVEPLLAYYDQSCIENIKRIVVTGSRRPGDLVNSEGVATPSVPVTLHSSWKNINFPEELNG